MKIIALSILCTILLVCSCKNQSDQSSHVHVEGKHSNHHHEDHNKSNELMNGSSFEDLLNRFEDKERVNWQKPELVIEKLGNIEGKKIGDIGAGTGYFSFRMANLGAKVTAIDVDERFIDFMKQKIVADSTTNLETKLVGYDNPELSKSEYDVLIIIDTYHHFNDKIEYMTYCFNGLQDNGILMNVDFKYEATPHGPPVDHRISAEDVKKDLLEVGFSEVEIDQTTLVEQYIIIARK